MKIEHSPDNPVKRCKHDTVFWKDYYGAQFRMCRLCDLAEVQSVQYVNYVSKGLHWVPVDSVTQHDASAMWTALKSK